MDVVAFKHSGMLTKSLKQQYKNQWAALLNLNSDDTKKNQQARNLAFALMQYNYIISGLNFNNMSFMHLCPIQVKEQFIDKETGLLKLDRVLFTSTHYPANYGFIPKTYSDDDDPLDVLVLCSEPIVPLAMVRCYPIGVIMMQDGGDMDYKIIAIPFKDPTWNCYKEIEELPPHVMDEISHFFRVYKQLEGKDTTVFQVKDRQFAELIIKDNIHAYKKKFEIK